MADHVVVREQIHIAAVDVAADEPRVFPRPDEPTVKHDETIPARVQHQVVDFMHGIRFLHFRPRAEGCEVGVFENRLDISALYVNAPDARRIRQRDSFCRFRHVAIAVAGAKLVQPGKVQCQSGFPVFGYGIYGSADDSLFPRGKIQDNRAIVPVAKIVVDDPALEVRPKPLHHAALLDVP